MGASFFCAIMLLRASSVLAIIDDLYVLRGASSPSKTDPPLVVDPDAVLALTFPFESLQPIPANRSQVIQALRRRKALQPGSRRISNASKPRYFDPIEEPFRVPVSKGPYHN
jgi:hypothetical protein